MPSTHPARAVLAALTLATITLTAAACNPESGSTPSPTSTPTPVETATPTPTPTMSEQDQNIADAKATYLAYNTARDAAAQAGFIDPDLTTAALNMTSGDAREALVAIQTAYEQNGLRQTGATIVKSVEATAYQEDPTGAGNHAVSLRACLDLSGSDTVYSDGTSTTPTDQPQYRGPRNVYVQMLRQPFGWAVHEAEARPEERC